MDKKIVICVLLFNLLILNVSVGLSSKVSAAGNDTSNSIYEQKEDFSDLLGESMVLEEDINSLHEDLDEELEVFNESEIEAEISTLEEEKIELVASSEINDAEAVLEVDLDIGSIVLNSHFEKDGDELSKKYDIFITSFDGEDFSADFVDQETGEVWSYSTLEAEASIVPAVVYFLGGQLLRVTISTVSKNLLKNSIKIGNKVYKANKNSVAKNALSKIKFTSAKFKVGSTGRYTSLSKSKFEHILQRHHPKYWNGTVEKNQSFFDPKMSLNTVQNYIKQTISGNSSKINSKVNSLKGKKGTIEVTKKIKGIKYKLVLNVDQSKKISVKTFYPVK